MTVTRNDVFEFLVDGVSGLAPGDVTGKGLIVGCCSAGVEGTVYHVGRSSDLSSLLGVGPLVDTLDDIFSAGGQDLTVLAVPTPATTAGTISAVEKSGSGPEVTTSGSSLADGQVIIEIVDSGALNVGSYQLSIDGGDNFTIVRTIPLDGIVSVDDLGITCTFATGNYVAGDTYTFETTGPTPSTADLIAALQTALDTVDPELICIASPTDSSDWTALGVLMDDLFARHRPTFCLCQSNLPTSSQTLDTWVTSLKTERSGFAHRFVSVCSAWGDITGRDGRSRVRGAVGLLAGRVLSIPVQRAPGRVRDGGISNLSISSSYNESHQAELEEAGYVTAKRYASLESLYWSDSLTMAEDTSDYRWIPVLRTVFKGLRLLRIQALKSMYDEAGDPIREGGAAGINYLKANLEHALDTMVRAVPQELAGHEITIPSGQDITNNGLAVEVTFIGIPIIRRIELYASYVYAGSVFDPRLEG